MSERAKPKFKVGQVVVEKRNGEVSKVIGHQLGSYGKRNYFCAVLSQSNGISYARPEQELRPLTKRERGERP